MAKAEFIGNGTITIIQCNENDKLEEIIKKYCIKTEKNKEEMTFLYGGHIIDDQKTFNEIANLEDKQRKQISILINDNKTYKKKELKKSKYIICPKCKETASIDIKDYKIKIVCKNGHIFDYLSFLDFNKNQLIDESNIICDICKNNNKGNTYNNIFYICNKCNKNICPLCNSTHDKKHIRIEYEQKYFKCNIHNDNYINYCNHCNKNICPFCDKEHKNHNIISLIDIMPDENKLEENKNNLKNIINKFKENIKEIINKLNNIINNIEEYYNIYNNIIDEFEIQKRNYEILQNINTINNYNNNIINELNNIINDDNIYSKFSNIMNIYYKIYLNKKYKSYDEIKLYYENRINEIKNNI